MANDIRVIVNQPIKLGMTESKLGSTIPRGINASLMAKLSPIPLMNIELLSEIIGPQKALEWHVVDYVVDKAELLEFSIDLGKKLAVLGETRIAYQGIKYAMWGKYIELANNESYCAFGMKTFKRLAENFKPKL